MDQNIVLRREALSAAQDKLNRITKYAQSLQAKGPDLTSECNVCRMILGVINAPAAVRAEALVGNYRDILHSDCKKHGALFPFNEALATRDIFLRRSLRQNLLYLYPNPQGTGQRAALDAPWEWYSQAENLTLFNETWWQGQPRIVDEAWIDVQMIRGWLDECRKRHSSCSPDQAGQTNLLLLIDIEKQCLVWTADNVEYVALSYVWGDANHFVTLENNIERLMQPGALSDEQAASSLPRTISHSIKLTRALGEKFLWVDALCVVQDSASKDIHLDAMASIYANAALTIVAAEGKDADSGFNGFKGISEPRHLKQFTASVHPLQQLVKPHSKQIWDDRLLEPWSTRAWTFQEGLLSRRILYLAHDSVRWVCRTCAWSEETNSPNCWASHGTSAQRQERTDSPQLTSLPLPTLQEYSGLVNGFNGRALTFPEDVFSAFAGVSTELGRKFAGGLISGLPAFFFDLFLLWQPLRRQGPARRRIPRKSSVASALPSWSWAGWETEVTWPYTWNCTDDPTGPAPIIINHIRPFYQTSLFYTNSSGGKTRITSDWVSYAATGMDEQCPEGWFRFTRNYSHSLEFGQLRDVPYYRHQREPSLMFWFPVPVSDESCRPRLVNKLYLRSMVGHCKLGKQRRGMTQILTLSGQPAGTLWQHDEDDSRYVDATKYETPIELVVILGCTVSKDDHSWWEEPQVLDYLGAGEDVHEPERLLQVYNVLWIQREEDYAVRMGSGEVVRSVWDEVICEGESDLTLL